MNSYHLWRKALAAVAIVAMAAVAFALPSCHGGADKGRNGDAEAQFDSLHRVAWDARDLSVLQVVDSLQQAEVLDAHHADFLRGIAYDRSRHIQVGEGYYAMLYDDVDPQKEGWGFYLQVASRLSQIRMVMNDHKGSLDVATKTMERAEKAGKLDDDYRVNFLWSIALCQFYLGMDEAEQSFMEVYDLLERQARKRGVKVTGDQLQFAYNILAGYINKKQFDKAEEWQQRSEEMLAELDREKDSLVVEEYTWSLTSTRIDLLEEQGMESQATALFDKAIPLFMKSPEGMYDAANYLLMKGRYAGAADMFARMDSILPPDHKNSEMNLDNIGFSLIPRLSANIRAGRKDVALAIADSVVEHYTAALSADRESNAAELATIYETREKEAEIAKQQSRLSTQRWLGTMVALVLVTVFFSVYTWYRRRAQKRLATAHAELRTAYNQLEETTAAKERIESELRIARDIQMSMVPAVFPQCEGLDMYAEMTPAKEVGGDLYGYVLQGERLYFCVGDVSGKGVPASLFMAQSARLFRTFSLEGMMPADIAMRMNKELSEDNERGMFVTMFIGMLHLGTGHLDFCNCGHNAPVVGGRFLEMQYTNQPLGLWEDDPFFGESIEDIRGQQMLLYTDGINEAENNNHEQLGNNRLLELMASASELDAQQTVEMLIKAVEKHRDGANPSDDLTLMCIKLDNNS